MVEVICAAFFILHLPYLHAQPNFRKNSGAMKMLLQKAVNKHQESQYNLCPEAVNRFECYSNNTMADLGANGQTR